MIYLYYDHEIRIEARNYKEAFLKYYVVRQSSYDMEDDSLWRSTDGFYNEPTRTLKEFFGAAMYEIMSEMFIPAHLRSTFFLNYNRVKELNFSSDARNNLSAIESLFQKDFCNSRGVSTVEYNFNLNLLFILLAGLRS